MITKEKTENFIKLTPKGAFSVAKTFDCGQCFRFDPVENTPHACEFSGVAFGRQVSFAEDKGELYIYGATEKEVREIFVPFLGLDLDYDAIDKDIVSRSNNAALVRAVEFGRGIRILRQDPWEAVCSFIISQNNNIPRIKKIIAAMSERYGEPIGGAYAFPTPEAIRDAGVDGMFALKTGFRAKYLVDAAERVIDGRLELGKIADMPIDEAAKKLCEVKGIGPKIAACSLLFGFQRYDAFPIDVWIRRVMEKYFEPNFDIASLGPYAGIAQQYLFYYERYLGGGE